MCAKSNGMATMRRIHGLPADAISGAVAGAGGYQG
jgi:hypothetical protein